MLKKVVDNWNTIKKNIYIISICLIFFNGYFIYSQNSSNVDTIQSRVFYNSAMIYYESKDYNKAIAEFKKSMGDKRFFCPSNKYIGRCLYFKKEYQESEKHIEIAYNLCLDEEIIFFKAQSLYKLKEFSKSLIEWDKLISKRPDAYGFYIERGMTNEGLKNIDGAKKDYEKCINLNYNNSVSHRRLADLEREYFKNYTNAINEYDVALKIQPNYLLAIFNRALAYDEMGNYDKAYEGYLNVLKIDSNDYDSYCNLGLIQYKLKDYEGAIKMYNKSLKIEPNQSKVYCHKGVSEFFLDNYSGAILDLNTCLKFDRTNYEAYYYRGLSKLKNGDTLGCMQDMDLTIEYRKDYGDAYILKIELLRVKQMLKEAFSFCDKFILSQDFPKKKAGAYFLRSSMFLNYKQDTLSFMKDITQAIKLDSTNALYYFIRVGVNINNERMKIKLLDDINMVIKLGPLDCKAFATRAKIKYDYFADKIGACDDINKSNDLKCEGIEDMRKEICK